MQFSYSSGESQNIELTEGKYHVMISKVDVHSDGRLIVKFMLENGNVRTEWVRPELWVTLFRDLLEASGQQFDDKGGDFDTDYLIGIEGELEIVKREGTGKHEGRTFYNADRFIKTEPAGEVKKN